MIKFNMTAVVQMDLINDKPGQPSRVENTRCELDVSANLNREAYLTPEGLPTQEGYKALRNLYIQGLVNALAYSRSKGWVDTVPEFNMICMELKRYLDQMQENKIQFFTEQSIAQRISKNKNKSTDKELIEELSARNEYGRYDQLIAMAQKKYFHDYKAPDDGPANPKILLVETLSQFPELVDIRQAVMNGDYDEEPDEEDTEALEKALNIKLPRKKN